MAFENNSLRYHIFKDYDIPFDEKGTTCGVVRLSQWVKDDNEPDESKARLEIRKVYTSGAEEKVGKGYTFSTPEGPHELAVGLVKAGFGDTKDILRAARTRDDFREAVTTINDEEDESGDGEMFDMREFLLSEVSSSDEDYDEE